jgi:hypothetical protein
LCCCGEKRKYSHGRAPEGPGRFLTGAGRARLLCSFVFAMGPSGDIMRAPNSKVSLRPDKLPPKGTMRSGQAAAGARRTLFSLCIPWPPPAGNAEGGRGDNGGFGPSVLRLRDPHELTHVTYGKGAGPQGHCQKPIHHRSHLPVALMAGLKCPAEEGPGPRA